MILQLETLATNAWPAAEVVELDGWRLRADGGITRRANSVWPNRAAGALNLDAKLATAERFYADRGLPTIFQLCPAQQPTNLDTVLADRGYRADAHTWVQTTSLAALQVRLAAHMAGPAAQAAKPGWLVVVSPVCTDAWFALYCAGEAVTGHAAAVRRTILDRIMPAKGFALLLADDEPAAVGLGVTESGWLGIFCMATLPACRRQGMATQILAALGAWGQYQGAHDAYLQVMVHNTTAQAMYAGAGFATAYPYHYRIQDSQP